MSIHIDEIIEGMRRVEEFNSQFRQPNPNGRYPVCKPTRGFEMLCMRQAHFIHDGGPCPAVPPDKRWGEDWQAAGAREEGRQ